MKTILFFLLLVCNVNYAQKAEKIVEADFGFEEHPLDSLAGASYIFTKIEVEYRMIDKIELVLKYHDRIRIYNEEGEAYAQFEIGLSNSGKTKEKIKGIKAVTYNLENGKITKSKLEKKQIFEEQVSENYRLTKFALPNVKAGSIIDVYYEVISPFIYTTPMFYYQEYIPVDYASYKVAAPNIIGLTPIAKGYTNFTREETGRNLNNRVGREVIYSATDLKPIKKDEYVLNENDYRSGLRYELHSISWPNSPIDYYSKSWESIGENLYKNPSFGRQLTKNIETADDYVESIASEEPLERAKLIYDYVRTNYTWNEEYGKYSDDGLKPFSKKKTGNIADMNLLLTNLLLKSDIDASPFVIKPRHYGILNEGYPSLTELSYVTSMVFIGDKNIILDASSKDHPFGILPLRAISYNGLLVKKEKSKILEVSNENKVLTLRNVEYSLNLEEECLEGLGSESFNDFASVKYRLKIKDIDDDEQDIEETRNVEEDEEDEENDEDEDDYDDEEDLILEDIINIIDINNIENIYDKVKYEFSEKKYECYKAIGDQIFLNADLDLGISKNPFIEKSREYPVYYNYKVDLRRVSFVNIPEGYAIDALPEKLIMSLPDKNGQYIYEAIEKNVGTEKAQIMITTTFKVSKLLFLPNEYSALNQFYDLVIKKQNEKIILKKIK